MFIIVAILNITATIGLTIFRLIKLAGEDNTSSPDFTFAVLILVNASESSFLLVTMNERVG